MAVFAEWEVELLAPKLGAPLAEYLSQQIPRIARSANAHYRHIPADDYEQVMWVAALGNPRRFREPFDEGKLWAVNKRLREAASKSTREDSRYRRAIKAAETGYSTDDEEFYSTGLLGVILPALIVADMDPAVAMATASKGTDAAGVHIHTSDPFGGAENYQVMLVDIATAFNRLSPGQRRLLTAYYGTDQEDTQDGRWEREKLASSMGLTAEALRQRAFRALGRLQAELGGESPWRR